MQDSSLLSQVDRSLYSSINFHQLRYDASSVIFSRDGVSVRVNFDFTLGTTHAAVITMALPRIVHSGTEESWCNALLDQHFAAQISSGDSSDCMISLPAAQLSTHASESEFASTGMEAALHTAGEPYSRFDESRWKQRPPADKFDVSTCSTSVGLISSRKFQRDSKVRSEEEDKKMSWPYSIFCFHTLCMVVDFLWSTHTVCTSPTHSNWSRFILFTMALLSKPIETYFSKLGKRKVLAEVDSNVQVTPVASSSRDVIESKPVEKKAKSEARKRKDPTP